jgi:hypothetical protein
MLGCKIGVDVDLSRGNGDLPVPSRETIFLDYNFVIAGDHADRGGCAANKLPVDFNVRAARVKDCERSANPRHSTRECYRRLPGTICERNGRFGSIMSAKGRTP